MTLLYIGMGVDAIFPKPLAVIFFRALVDAVFTRNPLRSYKVPLTDTWVGPLPQQLELPLLTFAVTLVDVAASVATTSVLVEVGT
jgi:hypothetical protein